MSGQPLGTASHPPHGHPDNTGPSTQSADKPSTASHPPRLKPDPTISTSNNHDATNTSTGAVTSSNSSSTAELSNLKSRLKSALRQYPDFPTPGILFEDILPIFADPTLHEGLIKAFALQVKASYGESQAPDVIIGLEARGFLFGPSLALRLGASFVPVRKKGKLPGKCETASFEKEYGQDFFQIQSDAIKQGQRVLVVDDIIATGGSAVAAGSLVKQAGGILLGYMFMMELDFLKGRDKLDAPVYTLLSGQEKQ